MIKKALSLFSVLLFFSLPTKAATTGIVSDADVLNINCSVNVCLAPLNIKKKTYAAPYSDCNGYASDGTCNTVSTREVYGTNSALVNSTSLNRRISIEAGNPLEKVSAFHSCVTLSDGNNQCIRVDSDYVYNSTTGTWSWVDSNSPTSTYVGRNIIDCPASGIYIWGQGCMVDGYSFGGTTFFTVQSSPVGTSTCTDNSCQTPEVAQSKAASKPVVGNPIDVTSGAKFDGATDINFPIAFNRTYSSNRVVSSALGVGWKHQFEKSLTVSLDTTVTPNVAMLLKFTLENDTEILLSRNLSTDPFTPVLKDQKGFSITMSGTTYILNSPNGSKEHYDSTGKLIKMIARNGYTYDLAYTSGKLTTVTDSYGRSLTFAYTGNLINKITGSTHTTAAPNYVDFLYVVDSLGVSHLSQAKFNNTETLNYTYTTTAPIGLLATKKDAKAQTYAYYTYNAQKRVTESKHQAATGVFVDLNQYAYSAVTDSGFTLTQTLPDSSISTFSTVNKGFANKTSSSSLSGGKNTTSLTYDDAGNVTYLDDGVSASSFSYDSLTNLLSSSTVNGKTRTYTWDTTTRLISSYTETAASGTRTYSFTYDSNGNITQKQITSGTTTRAWNYTYGTFGKILTMTEPTGAVTTFTYYADNDTTVNRRGLLKTVTNAVGHVITMTTYDTRGNPLTITLPNSLTKTMTYNQRGLVLTEALSNGTITQTNTYTYDANNQMTVAQLANGYTLTMIYDMAHRLTNISDNRTNSIALTLDNNGNPTNESEYTNSVLMSVRNKVFDGLSRMTQMSRASGAYAYNYTYDKRNRTASQTNPNTVAQTYAYNNQNDVTDITGLSRDEDMYRDNDGNITTYYQQSNSTSFTYNNFYEMLTMTSPDSGSHTFTYNIPSKTTTHTDNSGTVTTTVVDNLGRPLTITRVNGSTTNTQTYVWDTIKQGKLTSITDSSGSTVFAYDSNSRVSSKTQNITTTSGTFTKVVSYTYDNAGQLTKITYPSGMEINYAYTNGVITSVKRGTTNLVTAPKYKGFSTQPYGWTWGNSTLRTLTTNTSNRLTSLVDGTILNQTYTQDNVDNVTAVTDSVTSANTFSATYTASEQLTNFTNSSITRNYLQDTKFNVERITPFNPTTSALYYNLTSNKINSLTYGSTYKYPVFDNKGNMTNDGNGGVFTYDLANNMITATKINSGVYKYNSLNQRVEKAVTVSGTTTKTYYIYDLDGVLLGEYNAAGTAIAEHVYLNNIPVAVTKGVNNYFVHTDYLNTPRAVSSSTAVVWRWNNTNAYGYNAANETISGVTFEYNPRFAGQYFDKETGLHYNYHRMYNPELARYMQPDPIGVNGGMNIYSYVENNPLNANDPFGLFQEFMGITINNPNKDYPNGDISKFPRFGGLISPEFKYSSQFIYTDKGATSISVGYLIEAVGISGNFWKNNIDASYNCHGLTFLQGRGWINDNQVQKILDKDYVRISGDNLTDNDIVIYRENNQIKHSATISFNNNTLMTFGKDGVNKNIKIRTVTEQWPNATSVEFYRYWRNQ